MVEDLQDSETKLSKLLEQYHNHGISDENGENGREDVDEGGDANRAMRLRRNMEEYQNKLAQLQEQQANLMGMQMRVRERLNEARQAQQMLLQQEDQNTSNSATWEDNRASVPDPTKFEQLESQTAVLKGKLASLQTRKKHMDHLVAELQALEASSVSDRGSCLPEGARNTIGDKAAELEAMKAQLAHMKTIMEHTTRIRESLDSSSEPEQDIDVNCEGAADIGITEEMANISFESRSDSDDVGKIRNSVPTIEDIQEQTQPSNANVPVPDHNSQRSSGSQASHTSTPANIWPPSTTTGGGGSNEQSVDGISTSENLLDIGPQITAIENGGFNNNWWACPVPPPSTVNQGQHASVEYYRQLLLGSQAQQLQMMGTTVQQCCQLLWAQQRELQSMRAAISQLQLQVRSQNEVPQRANNAESQEEYSNLSRSVHNLGDTLDATLPPSSSLPNLVSLPNSSTALSHTPIVTSNSQQQQQQQLNNQVPPGNRANNYWDNFRSDEDSDVGAILGFGLENQSSMTELVATSHVDTASSPASSQVPLIDHLEISGTFSLDCASALPSTSNAKPGYNEDLAEADQSRPESSRNQKPPVGNENNEKEQEEAASYPIDAEAVTPDFESLAAKTEDERADDTELDTFLTRLHH
ncbi:leucine-rich repeat-containing protein [Lasius niger]|uniref:Leucine-rich repeat-containing protein n=1 Tax=Lasius niger TaxID=67767 RepID=A0A0J7KD83_LASNI|nr:leucine-rich repeat-containing protein [Lasius niger]